MLFLDTNLFYDSDSLTAASTTSSTKTLYDVSFGFGVDKKDHFQVGWNITGHSLSDTSSGTVTSYASTQMGPIFIFNFGKDRNWRLSAAYNLQTSGTYTAGSASQEKWKGTGIGSSFGYQYSVTSSFYFGLRLNYSMTTYTESLIGLTYSTISYKRTLMYPSIALTFEL